MRGILDLSEAILEKSSFDSIVLRGVRGVITPRRAEALAQNESSRASKKSQKYAFFLFLDITAGDEKNRY